MRVLIGLATMVYEPLQRLNEKSLIVIIIAIFFDILWSLFDKIIIPPLFIGYEITFPTLSRRPGAGDTLGDFICRWQRI